MKVVFFEDKGKIKSLSIEKYSSPKEYEKAIKYKKLIEKRKLYFKKKIGFLSEKIYDRRYPDLWNEFMRLVVEVYNEGFWSDFDRELVSLARELALRD